MCKLRYISLSLIALYRIVELNIFCLTRIRFRLLRNACIVRVSRSRPQMFVEDYEDRKERRSQSAAWLPRFRCVRAVNRKTPLYLPSRIDVPRAILFACSSTLRAYLSARSRTIRPTGIGTRANIVKHVPLWNGERYSRAIDRERWMPAVNESPVIDNGRFAIYDRRERSDWTGRDATRRHLTIVSPSSIASARCAR